ncbi:MAG: hypothetical protein RJP95_02725 [Pirellulales bacterium]
MLEVYGNLFNCDLHPAADGIDLLTVLTHELGLGEDREDVMYESLGPGQRRLPSAGEADAWMKAIAGMNGPVSDASVRLHFPLAWGGLCLWPISPPFTVLGCLRQQETPELLPISPRRTLASCLTRLDTILVLWCHFGPKALRGHSGANKTTHWSGVSLGVASKNLIRRSYDHTRREQSSDFFVKFEA